MAKKLLLFFLIFLLSLQVITDPDFGWHIRVGEYIASTHSVPQKDIFSFSLPNYPYVYHSWASELLMYLSYRLASFPGVTIMFALVTTISIFFLYQAARLLSNLNPPYLFFLILPLVAYPMAGGRTRTFGLLFLSIVYFLFIKFQKQNTRLIYLVPPIFLLWVNFHGSFILGIFTLALLIAVDFLTTKDQAQRAIKTKILSIIFLLSTGATLINPYALRAWQQAIEMSTANYLQVKSINSDWLSLASTQTTGWIFGLLAAGVIILANLPKIKIDIRQKIFLLISFALSLINSRFSLVLFAAAATVGAQAISQFSRKLNIKVAEALPVKIALSALIAIMPLLILANLLQMNSAYRSLENYSKYLQREFPKKFKYAAWSYDANKFLVENLATKRVANDANWGGLMLLVNPDQKVFYYGAMDNFIVDGRSFAFEFLDLVDTQPGYEEKLKKYQIDAVFLPKNYPLVLALKQNPDWQTVYEDEKATVLLKR